MLKKIRQILAVICILLVTLIFVDFSGLAGRLFGWIAKIQFLPALLALNVGVIVGLAALTMILGRVYCSVICPLGIMQDIFAWLGRKSLKNRYSFSRPKTALRWTMLALLVICFIIGLNWIVAVFAPYSAYGRIASELLAPLWDWGNNLLAVWAERHESYTFYTVDVRIKGVATLVIAIVTLIALGIMAWRNGRTYCNTVCPVGTILGMLSKYSLFRPVIDTAKCVNCGLCARNCKSSCIDTIRHKIDYSRCVACMDCIDKCSKGAIKYTWRRSIESQSDTAAVNPDVKKEAIDTVDESRRRFLTATATVSVAAAVNAASKTVDGGLAPIIDKVAPERRTRILPPGALSIRNFESHCTACQLCVSVCPNAVLRPSTSLDSLMQPESSYEAGYCRPECTRCSNACPSGAIRPITREEKSSIQIGYAVWIRKNCLPVTDGVNCGNCARHCPAGAITMIPSVTGDESSVKIPAVNVEKCIGCGACENLCPARPFSAIYVEGRETQREI